MQIKEEFFALSSALNKTLDSEEVLLCTFSGEHSDFVRLNNNRIRQAGSVCQYEFGLQLIRGNHHCSAQCNISGQHSLDLQLLIQLLNTLREQNKKSTRGAGGLGLTPRRRSKYLAPEGGKGCCVPVIPHFKTEC